MKITDYNKVTDRISPSERCRREVLDMANRKNRGKTTHKRIKGRTAAVIIGLAVAVCGGTAAVAAERGAFDKLINKRDRTIILDNGVETPIDKFDYNDYSMIAPNATQFEEVKSASNDYFTVELDSVYFDGMEMILGFSGELADGNELGLSTLGFTTSLEIQGEKVAPESADGIWRSDNWWGTFVIDEGAENSFTGSMTCVLPPEARFDDTAQIRLSINNIWTNEKYTEENGQTKSWQVMPAGEKLELSAEVTANTDLVRQVDCTVEDEGFSATVYSITPAMMTIGYDYPQWYVENDETTTWFENGEEMEGPKYSIIGMFYDENGELIENLQIDPIEMADGIYAAGLQPPTTDTIYCRFYNKQSHDENGNMELIKELELDISELRE